MDCTQSSIQLMALRRKMVSLIAERKYDATARYHIHVADGLAGHGIGVVTDLVFGTR
jgi:hypothetical protein